jgi:hypothetical protein
LAALDEAEGVGQLVAIVPADDKLLTAASAFADRVRPLSWLQVAQLAYEAGGAEEGEWGGRNWMANAPRPEAPAQQYVLCSFINELREEGYAMVEPVTPDDIKVYAECGDVLVALGQLLEDAARRMNLTQDGPAQVETDEWVTLVLEAPNGSWMRRLSGSLDCRLDLVATPDDEDWALHPTRSPALAVGVSFDDKYHGLLSAVDDGNWAQRLEAAGFGLRRVADDATVYCYAALPFSELAGSSLEEQATALSTWASGRFNALVALDPGDVIKPSPGTTRRRQRTDRRR